MDRIAYCETVGRGQGVAKQALERKDGCNLAIRAFINYQVSYPLNMVNLLLRKALAGGG
jgi:hypothetical protein